MSDWAALIAELVRDRDAWRNAEETAGETLNRYHKAIRAAATAPDAKRSDIENLTGLSTSRISQIIRTAK